MKVLLIDVNCGESSTGKIVYDLYSYLNKNGDEATICFGRGKKKNEKRIYKFGIDLETYFHAFLTRVTGYTGCFSFFSTRRLIRYIDEYKPDIVHIHEMHAYFVNVKMLLSYLKKNHIPTITTLHCEFNYTGKCGHSVECDKWKTMCQKCPRLHEYVSTVWFDHTRHMFLEKKRLQQDFKELTIVTPSSWLNDRAKMSFLKKHDFFIIHNGIDTQIFKPENSSELRNSLGLNDEEKVVLSVAPNIMSKEKGGKYVLELAKKMKNENIRFVLVGSDNGAKTYDNVIILSRIYDKKTLAQFYSMADVFVICSERENFPTTCIEAQCCGTPVVGFDTGGCKETDVTCTGKFVEYGNIDALKDSIMDVLVRSAHINRTEIQKIANKHFSVETMCEKYYELYKMKGKYNE